MNLKYIKNMYNTRLTYLEMYIQLKAALEAIVWTENILVNLKDLDTLQFIEDMNEPKRFLTFYLVLMANPKL